MRTFLKIIIILFILFLLGINAFQFVKDVFDTTEEQVIQPTIDTTKKGINIAVKTAENIGEFLLPPTRHQLQNIPYVETRLHGGYCYIGTDRGARTCAPVGLADTCEGSIYPTHAVCMDPRLRP
jgi:hypothetical protein